MDLIKLYKAVGKANAKLLSVQSQYKWISHTKTFIEQSIKYIEFAGTKQNESIYDIGCGAGYLMWICREKLNCDVSGCDPLKNGPIYKELHEALSINNYISDHVSSIMYPLPKTNNRYDTIFATWITWIGFGNWSQEDLLQYINGCKNYLKDGGKLLLRFEESRFDPTQYKSVLDIGKQMERLCYIFNK